MYLREFFTKDLGFLVVGDDEGAEVTGTAVTGDKVLAAVGADVLGDLVG